MDRNNGRFRAIHNAEMSLSARRAWIEIDFAGSAWVSEFVALRKESVDRNSTALASMRVSITSLSARRAWIEILSGMPHGGGTGSRSPQGERG